MTDFDIQLQDLDDKPMADVLFFIACSDRKIETEISVPLRELYDGPTWQTLRTHGDHIGDSQIIVLSGQHGWVGAGAYSKPYNERMSQQKIDRLIERGANVQERNRKGHVTGWTPIQLVARGLVNQPPWSAVVICGGELYRQAIDAIIPELMEGGYIEANAPVITTYGGIGNQRSQLGHILARLNPELRAELAAPAFRL